MRYQRIDLNLLMALDALLAERNVTRAAERMHMTQSAMSGVLARLREYFDDALLVPIGRNLQLTARAESLVQPVREVILRIDATLGVRPQFEPASARRHFRVIASDYVSHVLLADVLRHCAERAPGLSFEVRHTHGDMGRDLDQGQVDFLITPAHLALVDHPQTVLFEDTYQVIACAQHAELSGSITSVQFLSLGHVAYQPDGGSSPWFEQWHANQGERRRRVEVVTHGFSLLPGFVVGTRRVAAVQKRLAQLFFQYLPIRAMPLPFESPRLTEVLQWHRFRDDDPGICWVRDQICLVASTMASG